MGKKKQNETVTDQVDHVVTQIDLDANPDLNIIGVSVGETVQLGPEITYEQIDFVVELVESRKDYKEVLEVFKLRYPESQITLEDVRSIMEGNDEGVVA